MTASMSTAPSPSVIIISPSPSINVFPARNKAGEIIIIIISCKLMLRNMINDSEGGCSIPEKVESEGTSMGLLPCLMSSYDC